MSIFLGHCSVIPGGISAFGVSVFIVLSGFLLTVQNDRKMDANIKCNVKFAWRKIRKLFPLHLICTFLMMLICSELSSVSSIVESFAKLLLNVFLIQSWIPKIKICMSLNGVAWYLSTCVFLYFTYPYIVKFLARYKTAKEPISYSVLAICLMVAIRIASLQISDDFSTWATYCFPIFRTLDFFVGCNVGWIVRNNKESIDSKNCTYYTCLEIFAICACLLISLLQSKTYTNPVLKTVYTSSIIDLPISCTLVVLFYLHNGTVTFMLTNKILVEIGNLSPYLFLIHYTVIAYCNVYLLKTYNNHNSLFLVIISFSISIVAAYLYRRLIEEKRNVSN